MLLPLSADFSDLSGNQTVTSIGVTIDATQFQWGAASGEFLGINDNLDCNVPILPESGSWTFECWAYADSTAPGITQNVILSQYDVSPTPGRTFLGLRGGSLSLFNPVDGRSDAAVAFPVGQWVHVAFVRDGNEMRVYQDGVRVITQDWTGGIVYQGASTIIGTRDHAGALQGESWDGWLQDIRVLSTVAYDADFSPPTGPFTGGLGQSGDNVILSSPPALGAPSLRAINLNSLVDPDFADVVTLQHFDGAFTQTASLVALSQFGGLVTTSGTALFGSGSTVTGSSGQYQEGDGFDWSSDFTIECFVNVPALAGNAAVIMDSRTAGAPTEGLTFSILNDGRINFGYVIGPTSFARTTTIAVSANTWHHIAMTYASGTMRMFIDGVLGDSFRADQAHATPFQFANTIGRFFHDLNATASRMLAYVDDLRVSRIARYTAAFTPPTTAFPDTDQIPSNYELRLASPPALGLPAFLASNTGVLLRSPPAVGAPRFRAINDFTAQIVDGSDRYVLQITGNPVLEVKIRSWQGTFQIGRQSYLQAVIPNPEEIADQLAARRGIESMQIVRRATASFGPVETLIASAPLEAINLARGPINSSATVSGYSDEFLTASENTLRELTGIRSVFSTLGGDSRIRADVDWFIQPGQRASGGGITVDVDFINYYVTDNGDAYIDVGSRGAG